MKLQLDTVQKVIRLEESVNLGELQGILEKLLPDGQWREFKLEPSVINKWTNPIIIDRYRPSPFYPWWQSTPIYQSTGIYQPKTSSPLSNPKGVYNLSISQK